MRTMSDVGEKAFLRALLPALNAASEFVNGFGHDSSIIDLGLEELIAFKIDRAPYPVAIKRGIGDYRTWGRLAVAANISDILAVGGNPRAMMLSIIVPGDFDVDDVRDIVLGCEEACLAHNVVFLGGDTKEGPVPQVVGAALGTVQKRQSFGRAPANAGDYLFVAGGLGAFGGAMALLDAASPNIDIPDEWASVLTNPTARIKEGAYLRGAHHIVAACDLSDGLSEAINIFCAGGVGLVIDEAKLPLDQLAVRAAEIYDVPAWRLAFGVGDWAIACVVRDADIEAFRTGIGFGLSLHEIGRFDNSGRKRIVDDSGGEYELPEIINEHFRQRAEDGGVYLEKLIKKLK